MALTPISLGVRSNVGRTSAISVAKLVNCYAEDAGDEGKIRFPIVACDGFERFDATISGSGTGAIRAGLELSSSAAYVVSGTKVVKVNAAGSPTLITGSVTSSGMITMARNRKEPNAQIAIVSSVGDAFYILENDTLTSYASTINDLDSAGTLTSVAALDGYFVLLFDNGEFFITSIDEGTEIDELEFAKAETNPDGGMRVAVRGRDLLLFGPKSVEGWINTGAADFPFERSGASNIGCYAAGSVVPLTAVINDRTVDTVIWAATNSDGAYAGLMMLTDGLAGQKISTGEIDRAIEAVSDPTTIRAFTWSRGGHTFYCITDLATFSYSFDTVTGFWHQRTSSGLDFWRISMSVIFGSKVIVGDYANAKLYWMHPGVYDDENPSTLTLRHSNNHGDNWLVARSVTANASRVKFNRLGQSKEDGKVFQITISRAVMEDDSANSMIVQPPAVHAWPRRMRFYKLYIDTIPGAIEATLPSSEIIEGYSVGDEDEEEAGSSAIRAVIGIAVDAVTLAA